MLASVLRWVATLVYTASILFFGYLICTNHILLAFVIIFGVHMFCCLSIVFFGDYIMNNILRVPSEEDIW